MSFLQCKLSDAYYIKIKYLNVASVVVNNKNTFPANKVVVIAVISDAELVLP